MGNKNRHKVRGLTTALKAARRERDQLKRDIRELIQYADEETQRLHLENEWLKQEQEQFQLRVLELKQQVDHLSLCLNQKQERIPYLNSVDLTMRQSGETKFGWHDNGQAIDLADLNLAFVGGRPNVRRMVIQELCIQYELKNWVEIPSFEYATTRQNRLKAKLHSCQLIFLVTGYMNHPLTEKISHLHHSGALSGRVVLLNCKGRSGIVREVLHHVTQLLY